MFCKLRAQHDVELMLMPCKTSKCYLFVVLRAKCPFNVFGRDGHLLNRPSGARVFEDFAPKRHRKFSEFIVFYAQTAHLMASRRVVVFAHFDRKKSRCFEFLACFPMPILWFLSRKHVFLNDSQESVSAHTFFYRCRVIQKHVFLRYKLTKSTLQLCPNRRNYRFFTLKTPAFRLLYPKTLAHSEGFYK